MVANSSNGSMNKAPSFDYKKKNPAWGLRKKIAKNNVEFGNPSAFDSNIKESKGVSFTITFKDPIFYKLMREYIEKNETAHGSLSFTKSNWYMTIVLFYKPYFLDQPKDITLSWGYSLFPDKKGNFVKKKMSECT
jgi:oleate hydratase